MAFRHIIVNAAPPWLQGYVGSRLLYTCGLILDECAEFVTQGVQARMPGIGTPTALPYVGRDRKIIRGFDEDDDGYAARLPLWLDVDHHKTRGNPYALITQLKGYLAPFECRIRTVDNNGTWFTEEANGTRSVDLAEGNWDWDGSTDWSRFWVIIYPAGTPAVWSIGDDVGDPTLWGDCTVGNPTYTVGTTATVNQVQTIRQIVTDWKPAGTVCPNIIIAFDQASFDPTLPPGDPLLPGGDWGTHGDGLSTRGRARLTTARYWKGSL
jgi:hypothetical protein